MISAFNIFYDIKIATLLLPNYFAATVNLQQTNTIIANLSKVILQKHVSLVLQSTYLTKGPFTIVNILPIHTKHNVKGEGRLKACILNFLMLVVFEI